MLIVGEVKGFLIETSAVTVASTVILSAILWLFTPRIRAFFWDTLEQDPARYDRLRVESFTRQTAAGNEVVRLMLGKELEQLEGLRSTVEDHTGEIQFVHAAVMKQADEIRQLPIIAQSLQSIATSSRETAMAMKEIHSEVTDHGKRLERWDGYFEGQRDGEEGARRHRKRRHGDNEPDDL